MKNTLLSIIFAFSFLTRLPIPGLKRISFTDTSMTRSIIFFPLVGLVYGIVVYGIAHFTGQSGLPLEMRALLVLALPYLMNRFLHFDGLSDVADAFFADKTPIVRLRILKDSNIGSFALGIMVLFLLLKFILLKQFIGNENLLPFLIIIFVCARYGMCLLAFRSRYPREYGTGSILIGKISFPSIVAATGLCILILSCYCLIYYTPDNDTIPLVSLSLLITAATMTFIKLWAYRKIDGITGDVLGALSEITEISVLVGLLVFGGDSTI